MSARIGTTETVVVDGESITGTVYHVRENGWACVEGPGGRISSGPAHPECPRDSFGNYDPSDALLNHLDDQR